MYKKGDKEVNKQQQSAELKKADKQINRQQQHRKQLVYIYRDFAKAKAFKCIH